MSINIPTKATPVLLDVILEQINASLKAQLPWINYAFGKSERLRRRKQGTKIGAFLLDKSAIAFPAIYTGVGQQGYIQLLPDERNGNYSFFIIHDPQPIDNFQRNSFQTFKVKFSWILWYKFTPAIMPANEFRNKELVKLEVINAISSLSNVPDLKRMQVEGIEEDPEAIFREYTFNEIDDQFLMHPYSGIRVNGTLHYRSKCNI